MQASVFSAGAVFHHIFYRIDKPENILRRVQAVQQTVGNGVITVHGKG